MRRKNPNTRTLYAKNASVWIKAERVARLSGKSFSAFVEEVLQERLDGLSSADIRRGERAIRQLESSI